MIRLLVITGIINTAVVRCLLHSVEGTLNVFLLTGKMIATFFATGNVLAYVKGGCSESVWIY